MCVCQGFIFFFEAVNQFSGAKLLTCFQQKESRRSFFSFSSRSHLQIDQNQFSIISLDFFSSSSSSSFSPSPPLFFVVVVAAVDKFNYQFQRSCLTRIVHIVDWLTSAFNYYIFDLNMNVVCNTQSSIPQYPTRLDISIFEIGMARSCWYLSTLVEMLSAMERPFDSRFADCKRVSFD